mgnify:CR=1 FL=1
MASSMAHLFSQSYTMAARAGVVAPCSPSSASSHRPMACTSLNSRVSPVPQWSTTAPWNFSKPPRLFLNWKYCTESDPWATACMLLIWCCPGFFSFETGHQLVVLGVDSISKKGCCFIERIRSCHMA